MSSSIKGTLTRSQSPSHRSEQALASKEEGDMQTGETRELAVALASDSPADRFVGSKRGMSFGRYMALPSARSLLCNGNVVCLGARAFDLLILLLSSRGQIVSKDEITRYVWPTTIVDESNLRFQVACLRRAIGEERDRIKTINGRGYLFVQDDDEVVTAPEANRTMGNSPATPHTSGKPAIVIIDGDQSIREALCRLLRPLDANLLSYVSIEAFHDSRSWAAN